MRMPAPTSGAVASQDGTSIVFDRYGQGPAVVLVGGALQTRAGDPSTAELAALLATNFSVYHYDRRGRGDSGDTPPYAVEREVEDIAALVTHAGGSACVFGKSSGGPLALDAAAQGVSISKLALYEVPFVVDDSRPPVPDDYLKRQQELLASGRRGDMVELFMTTAGIPSDIVAQMRNAPTWPGFEAVAATLLYDGAVMDGTVSGKPLPSERWAEVTALTLVIVGGASDAWWHRAADALVRMLQNAHPRTLDGQTHAVAPEVLAPAVREHFAS
jgi:pimeloyl-ACP methyl ester carboxylesterase